MSASKRQPHIQLQGAYFDKKADMFLRPIPEFIQERTREIVEMSGVGTGSTVLDVGSGVGVLIGYFLGAGVRPEDIVGCDLSAEMLARARASYPEVFFWQGDVADIALAMGEVLPAHIHAFDRVFFNACFGNMFDQKLALTSAIAVLKVGGQIILSHPLGARFVDALRKSDPDIVPHRLPDRGQLDDWSKELGFGLDSCVDQEDFYYVALTRKK
ncbi:MAG TPA: class I SAM-dependent methyltransferase [Candidatus Melainabacteria bacterium]|nr:class I SAM-dependent methyltransferase [Candidatus Melainabacteria bacterium]HMP51385.1 class I SAM-dependent methyltransferase [Candidatus Melainabacteria bacterium]